MLFLSQSATGLVSRLLFGWNWKGRSLLSSQNIDEKEIGL
jgi:hypothetical protein